MTLHVVSPCAKARLNSRHVGTDHIIQWDHRYISTVQLPKIVSNYALVIMQ